MQTFGFATQSRQSGSDIHKGGVVAGGVVVTGGAVVTGCIQVIEELSNVVPSMQYNCLSHFPGPFTPQKVQ